MCDEMRVQQTLIVLEFLFIGKLRSLFTFCVETKSRNYLQLNILQKINLFRNKAVRSVNILYEWLFHFSIKKGNKLIVLLFHRFGKIEN